MMSTSGSSATVCTVVMNDNSAVACALRAAL